MSVSEKIKEEIIEDDSESQENTTELSSTKHYRSRVALVWLCIFSLILVAVVGGYFFYQRQYLSHTAKVNSKKIFGFAPSSKAPMESNITNSPISIHLTTDFSIPARHIIV